MAEKISISKGFDDDTFDTYVPELEEAADIRNALELFYYGNSEDGNATGDVSLHATIVDFDTRIDANDALFTGHVGAISDVHGVGAGNSIVGTGTSQTLTNKTLTSPKINENVVLTATSTELNYVDGVTSPIQTQLNTIVNTTIPNSTPVGTIVMFGASAAPVGWLLCDGGSTAGYAALAAVVGANVPDLRGRAPIGYGTSADAGITARTTLGGKTGTETVTLAAGQIPDHVHSGQIVFGIGTAPSNSGVNATTTGNSQPTTGGVVGTTGQAHPNMQPSTVVNFIIKY